jgi:outer membrane protein assembly factor BamB
MPAADSKRVYALGFISAYLVAAYKRQGNRFHQGKRIWESAGESSPSVANGVVYSGWAGSPVAYEANSGKVLWSGSGPFTSGTPIIVNGAVYGACDVTNVCAWTLPSQRRRS